jgi:hypothetical protein
MIEVEITPAMKKRAQRKAREMGKLKGSITKGQGNIAGFLGEEVANTVLQGTIKNTRDYDIIKDGITYDVKTKRCTSAPEEYYDCSVAAFNTVQKCDRYVFVRIENINGRWGRAWICGWIDKEEYFEHARFLHKGERDGDNWFTVKADCYNMAISGLYYMEDLE